METKVIRIEIKFTRTTLAVLLGSVLLLGGLVLVGAALAQDPDPETGFPPLPPGMEAVGAGEAATLDTLAAAGDVAAMISYQGRLTDPDGNPLSGDYDMTFQFWDAETDGETVGSAIDKTGVTVEDGLFDVELNVNPDNFNGQGLWLGITVGGETLTPTQQILPAPYALSLRPGAIISDTGSYVELNRYYLVGYPITFSFRQGVYAKAGEATFSSGVYGEGDFAGVYGYSDSEYGSGVYGYNPNGTAVYGVGDVKQTLTGNGLVKAAVYANCHSSGSSIDRSFNNVGTTEITIVDGASAGACTIDFDFDIDERFWVVSAVHSSPRILNCRLNTSDNSQLDCYRYTETGSGIGGDIMVLIY